MRPIYMCGSCLSCECRACHRRQRRHEPSALLPHPTNKAGRQGHSPRRIPDVSAMAALVDYATRRPRTFGRACVLKFRHRRVDRSANRVPQNLLSSCLFKQHLLQLVLFHEAWRAGKKLRQPPSGLPLLATIPDRGLQQNIR